MNSFSELNLSDEVSKSVKELGFEKPSPIQTQALPVLLGEGTDFIGIAATGTGKTAAFAIPFLEKINKKIKAVQVLVMCPTRELALQVSGQINLLGKYKGIKALPVYGGAGYSDQIHGLLEGAQVVVGTPGRLIDHLERKSLKLDQLQVIVLDEADEMISMGFKEDLETILEAATSESCHTWLFSATMSPEVRRVAEKYLKSPKQVQANRSEMLSTTVEQLFYFMRESDKPEILCKLIDAADEFYGLIFCQTKSLVTDLAHYMHGRGYKIETLHGDKSQTERERSMKNFRERRVNIMICTDVASRGLDVKDVTHVVNYSLPRELDVYVHRIGRTARSGKSGVAMSLVTASHKPLIGRIEHMTKSRMKEGRIPTRKDIGVKKVAKMLSQFMEQKSYIKAVELLGSEWQQAIAQMRNEEIVGRFLTMMSPEVFENQDRQKPLQGPVMVDSRGNALANGGRPETSEERDSRHAARQKRYGGQSNGRRREDREVESRGPRSDDRRGPRRDARTGPRRDDQSGPRRDDRRGRPSDSRSYSAHR